MGHDPLTPFAESASVTLLIRSGSSAIQDAYRHALSESRCLVLRVVDLAGCRDARTPAAIGPLCDRASPRNERLGLLEDHAAKKGQPTLSAQASLVCACILT